MVLEWGVSLVSRVMARLEVSLSHADDFHHPRHPGAPVMQEADGIACDDEPLDTPAYLELCARLGFDPAHMLQTPNRVSVRPSNGQPMLSEKIAVVRNVRTRARIINILPRLAAPSVFAQPVRRTLGAAHLMDLVERCLADPRGLQEPLDEFVAGLSRPDGALLLIGCAAHFAALGQTNDSLSLLAEALDTTPPDDRELLLLAADIYLRLNKPELAMDALTFDARFGASRLNSPQRSALQKKLEDSFAAKVGEHGHALLIKHLAANPPAPLPRQRVVVEIGTTRERLPGQGSTEKLARVCAEMGMDFVTVDMDPRNSRHAKRMFRRLNVPFRAVTDKGENFLATWDGPIDYCFLDAYDFDHGNHSELRQSRYENYLGARISDAQCHAMHLDCVKSLLSKLTPDGVICIDDTWLDDKGEWKAKGTSAMPFLLSQKYIVAETHNNAALLVQSK